MRDVESQFPLNIDDRIYFQDVNLSQLNIKKNFEHFLEEESYSEASDVLNNTDIDFFGASVLNLLENRLVAIEEYILTIEKPVLTAYQSTEPEDVDEGFSWIIVN